MWDGIASACMYFEYFHFSVLLFGLLSVPYVFSKLMQLTVG